MWNKIVNPITGRKVNINNKLGKYILKTYIRQLGGAESKREEDVSGIVYSIDELDAIFEILKERDYSMMYTPVGSYSDKRENITQTLPLFITQNPIENILILAIDNGFNDVNEDGTINESKHMIMNQYRTCGDENNTDLIILSVHLNESLIDKIVEFNVFMNNKNNRFFNLIVNYACYYNVSLYDAKKFPKNPENQLVISINETINILKEKIKEIDYIFFYEHLRCLSNNKNVLEILNDTIYNNIYTLHIMFNFNHLIEKKTLSDLIKKKVIDKRPHKGRPFISLKYILDIRKYLFNR